MTCSTVLTRSMCGLQCGLQWHLVCTRTHTHLTHLPPATRCVPLMLGTPAQLLASHLPLQPAAISHDHSQSADGAVLATVRALAAAAAPVAAPCWRWECAWRRLQQIITAAAVQLAPPAAAIAAPAFDAAARAQRARLLCAAAAARGWHGLASAPVRGLVLAVQLLLHLPGHKLLLQLLVRVAQLAALRACGRLTLAASKVSHTHCPLRSSAHGSGRECMCTCCHAHAHPASASPTRLLLIVRMLQLPAQLHLCRNGALLEGATTLLAPRHLRALHLPLMLLQWQAQHTRVRQHVSHGCCNHRMPCRRAAPNHSSHTHLALQHRLLPGLCCCRRHGAHSCHSLALSLRSRQQIRRP